MYTHVNKEQSSNNESEDKQHKGNAGHVSFQLQDNRPDAIVQKKIQETANQSSKAQKIGQLQKLAGENAVGKKVRFTKAIQSVEIGEQQTEAEQTNEAPVQLQLNQGTAYRVNHEEEGRYKTKTGLVNQKARSGRFPKTVQGQVYLVVGFNVNGTYTQLQPLTARGANFFIPTGNDAYYDPEPELDPWNTRDNTELFEVSGNAYNNQAPDAKDVTQGEMGDCWLIAPMMAMTMSNYWNSHIASLIRQNGQDYDVKLGNTVNINSGMGAQTQMVTISGWIPAVDVGTGQKEFLYAQQQLGLPAKISGGTPTPVWPSLLEKAAAKSYGGGSYQGLDDKDANIGFQLLGHTQPQTLIPPGAGTQPYANMILAVGSDAAATATTKKVTASSETLSTDASDDALMNAAFLGLIEDHVYIILPASSVQNLVLKNPHGKKDPTAPIPQAKVDDVIARIDYLPVPPVQQPQALQQQAPQVQVPQQNMQAPPPQAPPQTLQAPPQLASAVQQAHQQIQLFNQQQQVQAVQQIQLQPDQVQAQLLQQLHQIQQQFAQFQQQQIQQASQSVQNPAKRQKTDPDETL
ncbi:MAG: Calpain family cysteine protease [Fluviicola sp.]|jgi:hypothetical protein|uniref:C2 family cysteine protease n=1 Tax=Fluviicola sp. TaxID=1917219 RepID=UPI002624C5F3|nr:C2 family cysteine protease [Fluviicola sp.]MDF3026572.1 Calpain family cysteine protease [Fluviicola sp.]